MQMRNVNISAYELSDLIIPFKTVIVQYKDE